MWIRFSAAAAAASLKRASQRAGIGQGQGRFSAAAAAASLKHPGLGRSRRGVRRFSAAAAAASLKPEGGGITVPDGSRVFRGRGRGLIEADRQEAEGFDPRQGFSAAAAAASLKLLAAGGLAHPKQRFSAAAAAASLKRFVMQTV